MNKKNKESLSNIVVLLCFLVFIISFSLLVFGMYNIKKTYEYDSQLSRIEQKNSDVAHNLMTMLNARGVIGDSAGLLTASFAGFAFICVLLTLIFQFISSRFQNIFIQKQQFENTFFNMLSHLENIVNNIEYGKRKNIDYEKGRMVFEKIYSTYFDRSLKNDLNRCLSIEEINDVYNKHHFDNQILENYFIYLYRIIKFVHENKFLTDEEKSDYIDILRATLSPYELILLFYNGLCHNKMKKFIEVYTFLDNLRIDLLANNNHILFYNKKAYGEGTQCYYEKLSQNIDRQIVNNFSRGSK